MTDFGLKDGQPSVAQNLSRDARSNTAGLFSTQSSGKFISGARCVIKINGKIAVFATRVSWKVSTEQDEIWTIDSTTPYELAPKRISVDGTIGGFHIPGYTPSAQGIQSDILSFMFHKYISIEVRDRNSDTLMFRTNRAVVTGWSEEVSSDSLAQMTLTWKALGWINEFSSGGVTNQGDAFKVDFGGTLTHPIDGTDGQPK